MTTPTIQLGNLFYAQRTDGTIVQSESQDMVEATAVEDVGVKLRLQAALAFINIVADQLQVRIEAPPDA